MTVAVIVALLALVAAIVAGATWRRTADERRSVSDHQRTLETLRQLPGRRMAEPKTPGSSAPRSSAPRDRRGPPDGAASAARGVPANGTPPPRGGDLEELSQYAGAFAPDHEIEVGDEPEVLGSPPVPETADRPVAGRASAKVDAGTRRASVSVDDPGPTVLGRYRDPTARTWAPRPGNATAPAPSARPNADHGIELTGGKRGLRTRPWAMAAAAVAAVAAVVALALALPSHPSHPSANHSSPRATKPSHRSSPSAVVAPSSSSTFSATYSVSRAPFTVGLDASGPCWVMATDAAKGTVVWTGTLSAGEQHAIPATAALTVQLGSSNVAITLDGKPVQLPSGYRVPFNMTFRPR